MKKYLLIPFLAVFIVGCVPSVPKCDDAETKRGVKKIAGDEMVVKMGGEQAALFTYSLSAIKTIHENKTTGALQCTAQLEIQMANSDNSSNVPITYSVDMTDEGEALSINVFGLK